MDIADTGLLPALVAPARLLARHIGRWLPLVGVLAMVSALPIAFLRVVLPDALSLLAGSLDEDALLVALAALSTLLLMRLVIELASFMFAFVILADLTAGRPPDLLAGLRRLASWRLQGAWLVAGFAEQAAISLWFVGGGAVLVPFGLVTTAAYEEGTGFGAFQRSLQLGTLRTGPGAMDQPGRRLAVAVTAAFFVGFLVNTAYTLLSFATLLSGPSSLDLLISGRALDNLGALLPAYGASDIVIGMVLAPLALLPTIYMMTAQQMLYWQGRRYDEAHPEASRVAVAS
jgi:hypothetical protein